MPVTEIKKTARLSLKGKFVKCICTSIIYVILVMLLALLSSYATEALSNHAILLIIIQSLIAIVSFIVSYTLITNVVAIIKDNSNSILDYFKTLASMSLKYIKVLLQIILRLLIPIAIFIICYFYFLGTYSAYINEINFLCFYSKLLPLAIILMIASIIIFAYVLLGFILSPYICTNNKDLTSKEVVLKSKELMKKHKGKYILLMLSFIGWLLLGSLICYVLSYFISIQISYMIILILYAILRPYIITSEEMFYEDLDENQINDNDNEKN